VKPEFDGKSFYEALPEGRFRISPSQLEELERLHPERSLEMRLKSERQKVLLLDRPFQVGAREGICFTLHRVRLGELPGWPPTMPPAAEKPPFESVTECRFISLAFRKGTSSGQEGLEFEVGYKGKVYKAWLVGCPVSLLRCVEATLDQEGTFGKRLEDLKELRLVGS
jgi:hypothetical protein